MTNMFYVHNLSSLYHRLRLILILGEGRGDELRMKENVSSMQKLFFLFQTVSENQYYRIVTAHLMVQACFLLSFLAVI